MLQHYGIVWASKIASGELSKHHWMSQLNTKIITGILPLVNKHKQNYIKQYSIAT